MKFFAFLLFAILFSACAKDDHCIDDVIGNYAGSLTTDFVTVEGNINIAKAATGSFSLVITDYLINAGVIYTGTLSSDCKKIIVPDQNTTLPDGTLAVVGGSFDINGTALTGSLVLIIASTTHLTYDLTKG